MANENEVGIPVETRQKKLAEGWKNRGSFVTNEGIVVSRGREGSDGLDWFVLSGWDLASGNAILQKQVSGGIETKFISRDELLDLNSPVKTAMEWYTWYYRTTGSNKVLDPAEITDQLMTVDEFQQQLVGVSFENKEQWERVVGQFQNNLSRLEGVVDEIATQAKIQALFWEPLGSLELGISKNKPSGRRAIVVPGEPNLLFQGRTYSRNPVENEIKSDDLWRGYLQVELSDLPRMVEILKEMGTKMAQRGESLNFKYIYATAPDLTRKFEVGAYQGLRDDDPRIAVYFDDEEKRRNFFRELVGTYYGEMVEMAVRREGKARRPGTSVVFDNRTGREFRHIEMLGQVGYSEDVAKDPNWRNKVQGVPTYRL